VVFTVLGCFTGVDVVVVGVAENEVFEVEIIVVPPDIVGVDLANENDDLDEADGDSEGVIFSEVFEKTDI
jgi:hypothetical protein